MSTLNLVPDLVILGAQSAVVLTNLWVVKKMIYEPYFALRAKRQSTTVEAMQISRAELERQVAEKSAFDAEYLASKKAFEDEKLAMIAKAQKKREETVNEARALAKEKLSKAMESIAQKTKESESDMLGLVDQVSQALAKKLNT